jgi:hypothetical protein
MKVLHKCEALPLGNVFSGYFFLTNLMMIASRQSGKKETGKVTEF